MKICYDYEIFWKQKFSGVASRYFYNLITHMSLNQDTEIKVFANFFLNEKIRYLNSSIIKGIYLKKRIPFTGKIFEKFNSITCNYQISNFAPNVIHKTYYSNKIKKKNSRVILTVFDLWHEKMSDFKYMPKKDSLKIADHILCPSNKTKKDLIKIYDIEEKKIKVTYFGIENFDQYKKNKSKAFLKKPYILYVGARQRYKNFVNLIKAFASSEKLMKDFDILCFGGGKFLNEEKELFKKNNIQGLVYKSKDDTDQTLYNGYINTTFLVYPSSHEGLGLPPLEAMSLKCPVITSNHEAILEGVGESAIIFDPTNFEDIKHKIEETVYSNDKINKLKLDGLTQSKKFSWANCVKETFEVYRKY